MLSSRPEHCAFCNAKWGDLQLAHASDSTYASKLQVSPLRRKSAPSVEMTGLRGYARKALGGLALRVVEQHGAGWGDDGGFAELGGFGEFDLGGRERRRA